VLVGQLIVRIGGRWVCRDCAYTREYGIPWRSASWPQRRTRRS